MTFRAALVAATMLYSVPAMAVVDPPAASKQDGRMRTVVYSRSNPVVLYAAPGASLRIQFGADEKVVGVVVSDQGTIAPQDEPEPPAATGVSATFANAAAAMPAKGPSISSCDPNLCRTVFGSMLYLKPVQELDPQPLFVQTERTLADGRTEMVPYTFELQTRPGNQSVSTPHTAWDITFAYPDRLRQEKAVAWRKKHAEDVAAARVRAANTPLPALPPTLPTLQSNWRYGYKGSAAVAPDAAWDDSRSTFLRYNGARRVPNVYRRLPDGKESIPAYTTEADETGTTIRIAHTDAKWWVRDGDEAGCLFDLGPDPEGRTATTVASVEHRQ